MDEFVKSLVFIKSDKLLADVEVKWFEQKVSKMAYLSTLDPGKNSISKWSFPGTQADHRGLPARQEH